MSLTIEESQQILDLRVKMHVNIQEGRAAHFGLSPEEYQVCLDAIRGNRANAVAAGVAKATRAKKTKADKAEGEVKSPSVLDNPKFAKFAKFNLD